MHHYSDPREGTIPETWGECNSPIVTFEPARTIFFQVCVFLLLRLHTVVELLRGLAALEASIVSNEGSFSGEG